MESHEDRKLRPLLRAFHLRSGSFSNTLTDKKALRFSLERDIAVELHTPVESEENQNAKKGTKGRTKKLKEASNLESALKGSVEISLKAHFVDDEGNPIEGVVAAASYRAGFDFKKESQPSEIAKAMESEPYQYLFVVQAFPLAIAHFKEQLTAMGMNSKDMPLGVA